MLHNQDKKLADADTIACEMQGIVRRAAEPWAAGDSVKAGIGRAARVTGLAFRRARTLWYRQSAAISACEADTLRAWQRRWIAGQTARLQAQLQQLDAEWRRTGGDA